MAGHSKWSNIKHRKGAQDAKRAKLFTRIIKEVMVSVKESGADPDANPRLRLAIKNASKASVPKDKVTNAISKGAGDDGTTFEEVTFEGYAPHGVAVFVECLTDNNNRTVANVRAFFSKYHGSMGKHGSVVFMFERKGIFRIKEEDVKMDLEEFELELMDGGLDEFECEEGFITATCAFGDFGSLNSKLEELDIEAESSTIEMIPTTTKKLGVNEAKSVLKLIDKIEEDDDVQNIFHNLEMTDELAAALEEE